MISDLTSLQSLRENTDKVFDAALVSGILRITTKNGTVVQGWLAQTKGVFDRERGEWGGHLMLRSQDGKEHEIDMLEIVTVTPCDYPNP